MTQYRFLPILILLVASSCRAESPRQWYRDGREAVQRAKAYRPLTDRARNVILFIGDGMGMSTVTAARILDGQQHGRSGEEGYLSFEQFPNTALIKTYNTNQQVPDSAGTMSAIMTGIKTNAGVISVNQNTIRGDHRSARGNESTTLIELAERAGLATGIVTTTTVTHATPAACYAHCADRYWESVSALPLSARRDGVADIARQLIEFSDGDGLEVVLGGGRRHFMTTEQADVEDPTLLGARDDGRDLIKEWEAQPGARYVWNQTQFDRIDASRTRRLLGLFEYKSMHYAHDRPSDVAGEPTLAEMTAKAIDILASRDRGYFLMVEGARIDHAHHENNAFRALTDTIAFSDAVAAAVEKTDPLETLIIVTADHSHVFTIGGDTTRGNPILGKVVLNDPSGAPRPTPALDLTGYPYTTLSYGDGPGFPKNPQARNLTEVDTEDPDYVQTAAVPLLYDTHGGEDVPLYARGPHAYLFHGVMEQNVIFHVMTEALGLEPQFD
ncbi:MAG: alkaline phosphatase [Phycisphaerae bacterium]